MRPVVEGVESRTLLSGMIGGMPAAAASGGQTLQLEGTVQGHYHAVSANPDAGATIVAKGSGHVAGIGRTSAHGELHGTGFILQGQSQGDVTLKGRKGKVTIHLTGVPFQGGFHGVPSVFSFAITGGTGKYRGAHESGTATVMLEPGKGGVLSATRGGFVLTLTPRAIPL
jgi:hypothetical protein